MVGTVPVEELNKGLFPLSWWAKDLLREIILFAWCTLYIAFACGRTALKVAASEVLTT